MVRDFYSEAGKVALGSRLRRLSEGLTEDGAKIYALYDVALEPKWFPVIYVLMQRGSAAVTEIAQTIGLSHPSVSQMVKEMSRRGLVVTAKDSQDARVNIVSLSDMGQQLEPNLEKQCTDVTQAVEDLLAEAQHDLWNAIAEVEFLLAQTSFFERVRAVHKARVQQTVEIVDYQPAFHDDFKRLNYAWIEQHFQIDAADRQSLEHPADKILNPGGHIYMALQDGAVVGTCALMRLEEETYELVKMAVAETAKGQGIGFLLGQAAIAKARELGAKTLFLESNTVLEPAIRLYQKLGFRKVVGPPSPYARCNIQMELPLT